MSFEDEFYNDESHEKIYENFFEPHRWIYNDHSKPKLVYRFDSLRNLYSIYNTEDNKTHIVVTNPSKEGPVNVD